MEVFSFPLGVVLKAMNEHGNATQRSLGFFLIAIIERGNTLLPLAGLNCRFGGVSVALYKNQGFKSTNLHSNSGRSLPELQEQRTRSVSFGLC